MADNLGIKGPADQSKINIHETWELDYWSKKFGVSKEKLVQAVRAVGVSAAAVKTYLGK